MSNDPVTELRAILDAYLMSGGRSVAMMSEETYRAFLRAPLSAGWRPHYRRPLWPRMRSASAHLPALLVGEGYRPAMADPKPADGWVCLHRGDEEVTFSVLPIPIRTTDGVVAEVVEVERRHGGWWGKVTVIDHAAWAATQTQAAATPRRASCPACSADQGVRQSPHEDSQSERPEGPL